MNTLTITSAGNSLMRRQSLRHVHLEARLVRRAFASAAAGLAALVLAGTLVHGYQSSRPAPDLVTFAFRV